ncbi:tRNA pseudouridine(13) synthase TruD, partial [Nanoarchaeota archaeon]
MIIKQIPEDFIVREVPLDRKAEGNYSIYLMKKKGYNTHDAVLKVAKFLKIDSKFIGVAGNKDKIAVTSQLISVKRGPQKSFSVDGIDVEYLYSSCDP